MCLNVVKQEKGTKKELFESEAIWIHKTVFEIIEDDTLD